METSIDIARVAATIQPANIWDKIIEQHTRPVFSRQYKKSHLTSASIFHSHAVDTTFNAGACLAAAEAEERMGDHLRLCGNRMHLGNLNSTGI